MRLIDADALPVHEFYNGEWVDGVYKDDIDSAPTIEPEQPHWIPCSERLPDRPTGYLLFYFKDEYILADEYIVMIEGASDPTCLHWTGKEWCDINQDETYSVTAWMPLPEPYKGDTECQKS